MTLDEKREQLVVKSNALIQRSRFSLSLVEQKIMLYLISRISPKDKDFFLYEFDIVEFCKVCGINERSGWHYSDLKETLKTISDKSIWVRLPDGRATIVRWIEKPYIDDRSGTIQIRLDKDMKPFLLQLKQNYTQYELLWTLRFKSKYSIRLYELIKSVHYHELEEYKVSYSLDELKQLLDAENYTVWRDFRKRVLDAAVEDITQYSEENLSYTAKFKGRKIVGVEFTMTAKSSLEALKLRSEIHHELGLDENQMTLWDELAKKGAVAE